MIVIANRTSQQGTFVLGLCLLICINQTSGDCISEAPDNCTFSNANWCGWMGDNQAYISQENTGSGQNSFVVIPRGSKIYSRNACSTKNTEHCLQFRYNFKLDGLTRTGRMLVYVSSSLHINSELLDQNQWFKVMTPVDTNKDFTVQIVVPNDTGHRYLVLIDDIEYIKSPCQVTTTSTVTSTTTTASHTPTTTQETLTTVISTPNSSTSPTALPIDHSSTVPDGVTADTSTASLTPQGSTVPEGATADTSTAASLTLQSSTVLDGSTAATSASDTDTGGIVGAVIAVLIIVIGTAAVLVFLERRKPHVFKVCLKFRKTAETQSTNTAMSKYNGRVTNPQPNYENMMNKEHTYINHQPAPAVATEPSYVNHNPSTSRNSQPSSVHQGSRTTGPSYYNQTNTPQAFFVPTGSTSTGNQTVATNPNYTMTAEDHGSRKKTPTANNSPYAMANSDSFFSESAESEYHVLADSHSIPQITDEAGRPHLDVLTPDETACDVTGVYKVPRRSCDLRDTGGVYHVLKKEQEANPGYATSYGGTTSPSHLAGNQNDGDYNRLNFEGSTGRVDVGGDSERGEGGSGTVYSHLNQGGEGDYSAVNRDVHPIVIDDDYSHIESL